MEADRRSAGDVGTPIFRAAVAVYCGSALGASGCLPLAAARILVLGIPLAWFALRRRKAARAILPLILALGASLRAGAGSPAASEAEHPRTEKPSLGAWRPTGGASDRDRGNLDGAATGFAFVRGTVASGESVAVLAGEEAPIFARGPEPGPASSSGGPRSSRERAPDEVVRLGGRPTGICARAVALLERVRAGLLDRLSRLSDPLTRGLVSGLLFGDLSELPRGVGDLFVRTGTFHILAISGLQVVLVAVLLVGPIAKILALLIRVVSGGRLRDGSQALRATLLLLFVPVAGAGPPVLRSALTWVVGSFASNVRVRRPFAGERFMVRTSDPLSIWSLALLFECLVHPDAPTSVSVQLTYAATLGLIVGTGPIRGLVNGVLPNGGRFSATSATGRARPELARILSQKICDASIQAVAASLAAVLATLAVVWTRFGEWSPAGVLATPAIALPVAWILVGGWVWLAAPGLVPEAVLDLPSRVMLHLLELFDRIPGTPCEVPPRPLWLLLSAAGLTFLALARTRGDRERAAPAPAGARTWSWRAAGLLWAAALVPWAKAPPYLEVDALDVGHGTAAVIRSPGGAVWVFDAGSRDRPEVDREALAPLLRAWETARVGVVLSHPDRDHDGALVWLVDRYPPLLWAGALPAQVDARLPHTAPRVDVRQGRMRLQPLPPAGEALGLELSRGLDVDGNEGSRCLELTWRDERVVLCGDAEAEGLAAWLSAEPRRGPVRMLLFPHHGSDTNRIATLLAVLQPREVWISASGTPAVAKELARRGIRCRCTALEGPLRLELP